MEISNSWMPTVAEAPAKLKTPAIARMLGTARDVCSRVDARRSMAIPCSGYSSNSKDSSESKDSSKSRDGRNSRESHGSRESARAGAPATIGTPWTMETPASEGVPTTARTSETVG